MKTAGIVVLAFFAIAIGLYPLVYFVFDMSGQGFLSGKAAETLGSTVWFTAFYVHIIFGGLSLLTGWSQFSRKIRTRHVRWHRGLGSIYLVSVLLAGLAGVYLSIFANGGTVGVLGFFFLAVGWLFTTSMAFSAIKKGDITSHQRWMIRSYALTFAAVTLRGWLPVLGVVFHMDFASAYQLVSWLCWVPNLLVAEWLIRGIRTPAALR